MSRVDEGRGKNGGRKIFFNGVSFFTLFLFLLFVCFLLKSVRKGDYWIIENDGKEEEEEEEL